MRFGLFWTAILFASALTAGAAAQTASKAPAATKGGCTLDDEGDWDQRIKSCTAIIQTPGTKPQDLADAYETRAYVYRMSGARDRALADYNEATRLAPDYAIPYEGRGLIYVSQGNFDRALVEFNAAAQRDPKSADVYIARSTASQGRGDFDRSIADLKYALQIDPKSIDAHHDLGLVYRSKGDTQNALAEFTEEVKLDPDEKFPYFARGVTRFYGASLSETFDDLDRAHDIDPADGYVALWLDLANGIDGKPSELADIAAKVDKTAWPAPIIQMFLGKMTPAAVLTAAADRDPVIAQGQACEAHFFSGEYALRQKSKDEAIRQFQTAARDCPKQFDEWFASRAELQAMAVKL